MTQQRVLLDKADSINHSPHRNSDSRLCNLKSKYSFSCGTFCTKQTSASEQSTNLNVKKTVLDTAVVFPITDSFHCVSHQKPVLLTSENTGQT